MKPNQLFIQIIGLTFLCLLMQSSLAIRGGMPGSVNPGVVSNQLSAQSKYYHKQQTQRNVHRAKVNHNYRNNY